MKKIFYYFILPIILFVGTYLGVYNMFYDSSPKQKDANDTTIQFILLIAGIITIIVLFINFFIQKKQLKEQKDELKKKEEELNYNRAIDLVYKQMEYSRHRLFTIKNINKIVTSFTDDTLNTFNNLAGHYRRNGSGQLKEIQRLFRFLKEDLMIYKEILDINKIDEEKRAFIMKLVVENIYPNLHEALRQFQSVYRDFEGGQTYKEMPEKDSQTKGRLNDIEFDYGCILDTVRIKFIEGLNLGE